MDFTSQPRAGASSSEGRERGGLSPHALQKRVVLGGMAKEVKAMMLQVAYKQVRGRRGCTVECFTDIGFISCTPHHARHTACNLLYACYMQGLLRY